MASSFLKIHEGNQELKEKLEENKRSYTFPFPLDNFQEAGCVAIEKQENVLITAHTGSGKTVLALYGIGWALKNNKKVIYTSPIKSLSNQKYYEFMQNFGMDSTVGLMTGDIKINSDAQIMIMTTEILRNLLYKDKHLDGLKSSNLIDFDEVGVIIMDEVHYINDPDRGKVWEEVLLMSRPEFTLIMLSATLDKPEVFGSWIGELKKKPIHLIKTSHRVVPLKHYFFKDTEYEDEEGKKRLKWNYVEICNNYHVFKNYDKIEYKFKRYEVPYIMHILIDKLKEDDYLPALFFRFSRKKCEEMCRHVKTVLLDADELIQVNETFNNIMHKYKSNYSHLNQYQDVYKQIQKGVGYHHSGMLPILKEIVEVLFSRGLIKVLFATETFAIGVNMPTKTVIFSDVKKFDNNGLRLLRSDEYNQMAGRAGRRGLDKFGNVILLPCFDLPNENTMIKLMSGKSPHLNSKFQLNYQFVLKSIINKEFDIKDYLNCTFYKQEKNKLKTYELENKIKLEEKINNFYGDDEKDIKDKMESINEIEKKINNTYIKIKGNEFKKMNQKLKKLKEMSNYKIENDRYKEFLNIKKELDTTENHLWNIDYEMYVNMEKMKKLLKMNHFIDNEDIITEKGIICSCISEVNELVLCESIINGLFEDLEFNEIVGLLSAFINEKDVNQKDIYINDLDVSKNLKWCLKELGKINEMFIDQESLHDIHINTDFNLYLDFIEPSYIWANGGTMKEIYDKTQIYEGNFVKSIYRICNILVNLKEIFEFLKKYDILKKIENVEEKLLRNEASIQSLYVDGL